MGYTIADISCIIHTLENDSGMMSEAPTTRFNGMRLLLMHRLKKQGYRAGESKKEESRSQKKTPAIQNSSFCRNSGLLIPGK